MTRFRKTYTFFLFLLIAFPGKTQNQIKEKDFLKSILENHPIVDLNKLNIQVENQKLLELRSAFEPNVGGYYSLKNFDNKNYYSLFNSELNVQSPFGIRFNGGFIENNGVYLNPENNVPISGLVFAGVEVPLGAGLFTDNIRTNIRQQKNHISGADLIQTLDLNDLLMEGGTAFWNLYEDIQLYNLANEAINLATQRFNFVKIQVVIGEFPLIDTLEALLNFQNRESWFIDSKMALIGSQQNILNFIWKENLAELPLSIVADTTFQLNSDLLNSMSPLILNHPYLSLLDLDSMNNQLEYRLALEYFKPKFDVVLRIQESGNNFMNSEFDVMQNHYIGGRFAIPLLYRQQRAKAGMAKTKAEMIGNKKVLTQRELETKYESVINNISNLATMVKIWEDASRNYRIMLDAENQKFTIGESTLFVVNMREMQWIEGRTKYIQTYAKYRKELLKAYYTLGILPSIL